MASKLLLLEDVDCLGRKGQVVSVKHGFARNFLVPQGLAVPADKHTLRSQERLQKEREKKADLDRKESEGVAGQIEGITLTKVVKVDHEGHMYGSVSNADIATLIYEYSKVELDKKTVQLAHPIKKTGVHAVTIKLKEGITTSLNLKVMSEEEYRKSQESATAEAND